MKRASICQRLLFWIILSISVITVIDFANWNFSEQNGDNESFCSFGNWPKLLNHVLNSLNRNFGRVINEGTAEVKILPISL